MWVILLDVSGSMDDGFKGLAPSRLLTESTMASTKLESAKEALISQIRSFPQDSRVLIISFAGEARIVADTLAHEIEEIAYAMEMIVSSSGGTRISPALQLALEKVADANLRSRGLLITDGEIHDIDEMFQWAKECASIDFSVDTVLIDPNSDTEELMIGFCRLTNGRPTAVQSIRAFEEGVAHSAESARQASRNNLPASAPRSRGSYLATAAVVATGATAVGVGIAVSPLAAFAVVASAGALAASAIVAERNKRASAKLAEASAKLVDAKEREDLARKLEAEAKLREDQARIHEEKAKKLEAEARTKVENAREIDAKQRINYAENFTRDDEFSNVDPRRRDEIENNIVECSVFAPGFIQVGHESLIQVYFHFHDRQDEILYAASKFDPRTTKKGSTTLSVHIDTGARIDVFLNNDTLTILDDFASLLWNGKEGRCDFVISAHSGCKIGKHCVVILISVNGIPAGRISVILEVASQSPLENNNAPNVTAKTYDNAFCSFSHKDEEIVLRAAQVLSATKLKCFHDKSSLEPGDQYAFRIFEEIQNSDLFLLFWSSSARSSKWVRRECEWAKRIQVNSGGSIPDIIPVILEGPPPPKPFEFLGDRHFDDKYQYIIQALKHHNKGRPS